MDIKDLSDIQSESGVIGTLIYHPDYILHTDYLHPNYFFGTENGCIYWAIQELYKDGITNIDAYNISNKLQSNKGVSNTLEKYNMPSVQDFMDLYKETARHTLEEYQMLANNIVTFAFKRDLVKTFNHLSNVCYKKDYNLDKLSSNVYGELEKLTQQYISSAEVHTLGDVIDDLWQEICSRRNDNGVYGIPSKYSIFN